MQRRLAAILAADVVGYSRLMGADEAGTLSALKALRAELFAPKVSEGHGRIVKVMGDGALVEFPSAVDAVDCAVGIQKSLGERNAALPEGQRIQLRIGINLGDVIAEGNDIYGDGVNIAARLEVLAEPGGVCISGKVRDELRGKVELGFVDLGDQSLKNIAEPVRVYRVTSGEQAVPVAATAGPLSPPGKPSIAVLPFTNLSGDAEQEYFAEGITEEILIRLAMWRRFPVIGHHTSLPRGNGPIDIKEVGRLLGARYVLEGSVRKAGYRVRISGQLIDAENGHHVWGDRYDGALEDVFAVQDEITDAIVAALEPALGRAEMHRARRKSPESLDAWDFYQRGMWFLSKTTREDTAVARDLLQQSARRDPNFAPPYAGLALLGFLEISLGFVSEPDETLRVAREAAARSVRLDELDPHAQAALGYTCSWSREYDAGLTAARRAIELNPSFALGYHCFGGANVMIGRFDVAVEAMERAVRIGSSDPWLFLYLAGVCACRFMLGEYERSVEAAQLSVQRFPQYASGHRFLSMGLAALGRDEEARKVLADFLELSPGHTLRAARHSYPFRQKEDLARFLDGLRKAGLPE